MRMFLTAALAALALACTPLSAAWAACASDDAACQRAELATLAAELNTIADNFRDRGNAGAERRWRSAALAVEGNDGGISLADAKRWLRDSERNGWGTGKRMLPKVIAAIESLPRLALMEALQAVLQSQGIEDQDGQQQFEVANDPPQGESANAEIVFDGTIPVHSRVGPAGGNVRVTLRVGNDGTLSGTGSSGFITTRLPSVCIDPDKGCTKEQANADGWIVTKGQKGRAFTWSYSTERVWSDGFRCTVGPDCNSKTNSNSNGGVRLADGGWKYSTSPWWNYTRQNIRNPDYVCTRPTDTRCLRSEWIPDPDKDANARPWITGTHARPTINAGEVTRTFVAARKNGENDYTAFGYWMFENYFVRSGSGFEVRSSAIDGGAFAGGTNPATDVSGVSGTATYTGEAAGVAKWRDKQNSNRRTSYDGAPVTITADFDSMTMDTTIDLANRLHEAPGCTAAAGCLQRWHDVGPEKIRFYGSRINADGTFGGFYTVQADPEFRTLPDNHRALHTIANPNPANSRLSGRFYVPDGNNAPGQALGTFKVTSAEDLLFANDDYDVLGAFGTVKQ